MGLTTISVQLVEEHALVRSGVRSWLESDPSIKIVAESYSIAQGYRQLLSHHPDVTILGLGFSEGPNLETLLKEWVTEQGARIILLASTPLETQASLGFKLGARGYISQDCKSDELLSAICSVADGNHYVEPSIAYRLALHPYAQESNPLVVLTDAEYRVFCLLSEGLNVKGIADQLCLSPKSVGSHRTHIMKKLGTSNVAELAHIAIRNGLIKV